MRRLFLFAPALLMLVAAGCGGSSYGGGNSSNKSNSTSASAGTLAVGNTGLGSILVGANSRSLYLFEKDKGPTSTCNGSCAAVWIPFTSSGKPKAGAGIDAAKLTTSKRSDGKQQVVYSGHPLYYFTSDAKAGDTKGQNLHEFGADWYVLSSTGQKVEKKASSAKSSASGSSSTSSGSSGGGYYH